MTKAYEGLVNLSKKCILILKIKTVFVMQILSKKNWSPYVSGAIIGLLQIPLVLFLDKTLGVSSALSVAVYHVHTFFLKDIFSASTFNAHVWQIGLAFGIFLGSSVSARLSKTQRQSISSVWQNDLGFRSKGLRYSMSFIGGMFLIFGARLANGCTSGNGISGTSQLDASSWIVLISMFLSAILVISLLRVISLQKGD